jgi:hypothetical protein
MSLYKRNSVWWVRFTAPDGQRVRRSTRTTDKTQAKEFHDRLKGELWKACKLKERPKRTWEEAVVRWLNETTHKASHEDDKCHLRWLSPHLKSLYLDEITRDILEKIMDARVADGARNATANRMLAQRKQVI